MLVSGTCILDAKKGVTDFRSIDPPTLQDSWVLGLHLYGASYFVFISFIAHFTIIQTHYFVLPKYVLNMQITGCNCHIHAV